MKRQNDRLKEVAYHNANVLVAKKYCIIERERKVEHLEGELKVTKASLREYESSSVIQLVSGVLKPWSNKRRRISVNDDD
jgi:fructose-specific component phosphotransferase system IIB-like protein